MNQLCKVCGEPAAGFHFGAFTCEGCKSFFGRTYNNISAISGCKNNGDCVINKKNRTACKACRLRKCLLVGMSKSGSRYGRRSNWFKIHCLLQEQHNQHDQLQQNSDQTQNKQINKFSPQQLQTAKQTYQDKQNQAIKTANLKTSSILMNPFVPVQLLNGSHNLPKCERNSPSDDSGASSAAAEESSYSNTNGTISDSPTEKYSRKIFNLSEPFSIFPNELKFNSNSLRNHLAAVAFQTLQNPNILATTSEPQSNSDETDVQDEPIDLSVKSRQNKNNSSNSSPVNSKLLCNQIDIDKKPSPLDLTLINQYNALL